MTRDELADDLALYWVPCDHDDAALCTHVHSNGQRHIKFQCLVCGRRGGSIPRAHRLIVALPEEPPLADLERWGRWCADEHERRRAEWDARRVWYRTEYLQSEAWRKRAAMVLFRDRGLCQAKLDGCEHTASDVHHRTYANVEDEPLYDLVAVCRSCHERIEAKRTGTEVAA